MWGLSGMMSCVSRKQGESTEQWNARASAEYHAAWDAIGVERRRLSSDEGYDGLMDRLEAADCERGDAVIAMDRERRSGDRTDRMRADLDQRMTDASATEPQVRPVFDDFRDGNNEVDWARFRESVASWDAAQARPGAVQDPYSNLPAGE